LKRIRFRTILPVFFVIVGVTSIYLFGDTSSDSKMEKNSVPTIVQCDYSQYESNIKALQSKILSCTARSQACNVGDNDVILSQYILRALRCERRMTAIQLTIDELYEMYCAECSRDWCSEDTAYSALRCKECRECSLILNLGK